MTWICIRELCTWISITCKDVRKCVTTVVTRKKDVNDPNSKRLDIVDQTRTTLVEDEDDRLACLCESLHEVTLIL